jgi:hypothetical protein
LALGVQQRPEFFGVTTLDSRLQFGEFLTHGTFFVRDGTVAWLGRTSEGDGYTQKGYPT